MIKPKTNQSGLRGLSVSARASMWDRQRGVCPWCGEHLQAEGMHAHHRLLRTHGGTWDLANILGLHGTCHNVHAGSVHQEPARAYSLGFMIRSRIILPNDVPYYDHGMLCWFLPGVGAARIEINAALAGELLAAAGSIPGFLEETPAPQ